jgi:hypothetical protein
VDEAGSSQPGAIGTFLEQAKSIADTLALAAAHQKTVQLEDDLLHDIWSLWNTAWTTIGPDRIEVPELDRFYWATSSLAGRTDRDSLAPLAPDELSLTDFVETYAAARRAHFGPAVADAPSPRSRPSALAAP